MGPTLSKRYWTTAISRSARSGCRSTALSADIMQEPDNTFASAAVPEVQNKTTKPPGILPKNAQTWIVVGLAAVMFSVIAFSNAGTPKPRARETANRRENSPTQTRIDEYRAMVDEEARRLTAER